MKRAFASLVFVMVSAACGPPPAPPPDPTATLPQSEVVATITAIPSTAAPTDAAPLVPTMEPPADAHDCGPRPQTAYDLEAAFDYDEHRLLVRESIFYVNDSPETLQDLALIVEANRSEGVFSLRETRLADGRVLQGFALREARLDLPLPEPLAPGEWLELSLAYELTLPSRRGPLGYTSLQTNLGDWYPFVAARNPGSGWIVHDPGPVGEHLVHESADFHVSVELVDPPEGLTIAASGADVGTGSGEFLLCDARSFAWSASTEYERLDTAAGDAWITVYVFHRDAPAGPSALSAAAGAVDAFSALFATYPHRTLAVVEADFLDGMEYDGLVFVGSEYFQDYRYSPVNYLTTLTAHEVAHQWWYGLAGNDPATEPWLDEALATYSELLFYESVHPELADWWWDFRVGRFDPQGWVDSTVYQHAAFRPYVDAVYLRGALLLDEVRGAMGEQAFFAFLRDYLAHSAYRLATASDLIAAMDRWGGEAMGAIRARYLRSP